jgi:hypothetical protein
MGSSQQQIISVGRRLTYRQRRQTTIWSEVARRYAEKIVVVAGRDRNAALFGLMLRISGDFIGC